MFDFELFFFCIFYAGEDERKKTLFSRRSSYLNSNINPCMKVRKLLCRVKPPAPASRAIFPNTYSFQNVRGAGLSKKGGGGGLNYKIEN